MSEDLFPHPDPGDVVGATLDGRERALALVEAVTPTGAELAFDHAPAGVDDLTGLAVQMDFAGVDGMWRVDGQLAPVSAIAAEDGYRLRFEVTSTPQLARHRRFVRTNLKSKVSLFLANLDSR